MNTAKYWMPNEGITEEMATILTGEYDTDEAGYRAIEDHWRKLKRNDDTAWMIKLMIRIDDKKPMSMAIYSSNYGRNKDDDR